MEPKQESLWWASAYAKEAENPKVVEGAGKFCVELWAIYLGSRYKRSGKCEAGMDRTLKKGMNSR